jgi:formylglycine-generating enzyme required for sulfatase activity
MSGEDKGQIEKLLQSIATLETQQRELGLDFTQQIAELQRRLEEVQKNTPGGSGAVATSGGVAAGAGGVAVGGNVYGPITIGASAASEPPAGLRTSYLHWLIEQVRAVPLAGVDPNNIHEESRRDLDLASVYTALMTQRTEAMRERDFRPDREPQRLSALAVLDAERRLALLGDPGSGKSTFVNFLALCMAGELLGRSEINLTVLQAPAPEDEQGRPEPEKERLQPWNHGPLLPLRVVLRDFVARGLAPLGQEHTVDGGTLWKFIVAELPNPLHNFATLLLKELVDEGGLLLLDGLDEVPEADYRRIQVKDAVEQFAAAFPKVRILATSRTYAYQKQDWKLRDFAEAVLAPFGQAQIQRFVERWYAFVGQVRALPETDARGRATLLNNAIAANPRLYELATRPLLLTLMASLHAWRGGTLPDQREELYADSVVLLLDQWENQKVKRRPDGTYVVSEPSLAEWLRVDQKAVRQLLNRLAFEAHRDQPTLVGTADIAQDVLLSGLMKLNPNNPSRDMRPARLIEYLSNRAGLLEPRGVEVYAFPHRTFQEYLAACYLTERDDFPDNIADLLHAEPNRWREVTLLAGAKAVRGAAANAWLLADALCSGFAQPPIWKAEEECGYWGALLATQMLIENKSLEQVSERNKAKVECLWQWLTCILRHGALPPIDRAQAGDALAIIGDPRFRNNPWCLPDEDLLGFVKIPAGPFLMGSDPKRDKDAEKDEQPQHTVELPTYYMARYPVTVAQFRRFVEQSGYQPTGEDRLRGLDTHPVVNVTWYDAMEYCQWLTKELRASPRTPPDLAQLLAAGGCVTLPSEAEWEKAARGTDERIYPWEGEFDPNKANTRETGINGTSAVGCFPQGASPYEVLDMVGNVWEWTRSLWGEDWQKPTFGYPYNPTDARREDLSAPNNVLRVLRGCAFWFDQRRARCAFRCGNVPHLRYDFRGFRVVVLPKTLDSEASGL